MASTSNAEASTSAFAQHSSETRLRRRTEDVQYAEDEFSDDEAVVVVEEDDDGDVFLSPSSKGKRKRAKKPKPTPSRNVTSSRNNETIHARILLEATLRAFMTPFCAVTAYPDICSVVQVCHVVTRLWSWSAIPWMRTLEYVLGFPYAKTLNLDSRFNNILLRSDYHVLFDHMGFILLPLDALLKLIKEFVDNNISLPLDLRQYFLDALPMPPGGWEYVLLPLKLGSYHSIFVQTTRKVRGQWTATKDGKSYAYPFRNLPVIHSHVHPCYVMVNTWDKLRNIKVADYPKVWTKTQRRSVRECYNIVNDWINRKIPSDFGPAPAATIPSEPVVDEDRLTPPPPSNDRIIAIADVRTLPDVETPSKAPSKGKGKARATEADTEHFDSVARHIHFED